MGSEPNERPDWATRPEEEYVQREDEYLDEPEPETVPSGDTVEADRRDAAREHVPDRPPTPAEEAEADDLEVDPDVAREYKDQARRGAETKGEGRVT